MEDLLEEVVGDIEDEHDVDEEHGARRRIRERSPFPRMRAVAELNERFGLRLPECSRVCYDWRLSGRTPRSYSEAG